MKARLFLLGAAAVAMMSAMPAKAQDMSMMMMGPMGTTDANKDGAISKDEWQASFDAMDTNKDGTISKEEMLAHLKAQAEQMKAMYGDRMKAMQEKMAASGHKPCGDAAPAQ